MDQVLILGQSPAPRASREVRTVTVITGEDRGRDAGHSVYSYNVPGGSDGKESPCNTGDLDSTSGSGRPWRRKWQPTPALLPGEFHGQRSLAGYSP